MCNVYAWLNTHGYTHIYCSRNAVSVPPWQLFICQQVVRSRVHFLLTLAKLVVLFIPVLTYTVVAYNVNWRWLQQRRQHVTLALNSVPRPRVTFLWWITVGMLAFFLWQWLVETCPQSLWLVSRTSLYLNCQARRSQMLKRTVTETERLCYSNVFVS